MGSTLRTLVLVMATATVGGAGCAHGWKASAGQPLEARGSLRLTPGGARLLVTGPASAVHASVEGRRAVALFTADAVNGDDGDCAAARAPAAAVATESTRRLRVPEGQVLCVISAEPLRSNTPTEVLWHARRESVAQQVALR